MKKNEQEILNKALHQFKELTGFNTDVKRDVKLPGNKVIDAKIRITKLRVSLYVEIKLNITNQMVGAVVHQLKDKKAVLVTRYITPQQADRLKDLKIQFLDTAGNAYIDLPNMLVFIKGNKTKENFVKEKPIRAFQPAGLQLIYALICNPDLEKKPYRIMAKNAMIANGAVTWVIKDLKKLGFLINIGKQGRKLIKKNELLKRWTNAYAELLKPKLLIGKYNTRETNWWKHTDEQNVNVQFGGETAAALITKYLKPQNHSVYIKDDPGKIVLKFKLKKDMQGNIELLKKFWNFDEETNKYNLVNPVLIYADLIATGDNRNLETAKMIYDKEVIQYIRED